MQVGAYDDPALARRAATRAAERVPHLLLDTVVDVSRMQGRRGSIYRGHLIGLPYGRAQAACRALQAAQHDCLVVRADKRAGRRALGLARRLLAIIVGCTLLHARTLW